MKVVEQQRTSSTQVHENEQARKRTTVMKFIHACLPAMSMPPMLTSVRPMVRPTVTTWLQLSTK